MNNEKYQPISCDFYDELELLAMRKTVAKIVIRKEEDGVEEISNVIKTLYTKNKEEFLVLENGNEIRLDKLVSVNGIALKNYC
ncbi:MAG: Rho-binding antiterminator [Paraglaciecola sp.]|jgi:Rho-binding antiterminator